MSKYWRPEGWNDMVTSPFMYNVVKMQKENIEKALELELQHQAFRQGQEAGADAIVKALREKGNSAIKLYEPAVGMALQVDGPDYFGTIICKKRGVLIFIPDK